MEISVRKLILKRMEISPRMEFGEIDQSNKLENSLWNYGVNIVLYILVGDFYLELEWNCL